MEWLLLALWTSGEKPATLRVVGLNLLVAVAVILATSIGLIILTKYASLPVLSPWICAGLSLLFACLALILLNLALGRSQRDKNSE